MKAIVIGAGIGGLSAAVALKQSGIDCDVYEAVKEIKPVGAAISVWPNGVKCMAIKSVSDCLFEHHDFAFNFPAAMKDLNRVVMAFLTQLIKE